MQVVQADRAGGSKRRGNPYSLLLGILLFMQTNVLVIRAVNMMLACGLCQIASVEPEPKIFVKLLALADGGGVRISTSFWPRCVA